MNGFVSSLICILGWGFADLFYKLSSEKDDQYSHLKIGVWVGFTMGVCSLVLLFTTKSELTGRAFFTDLLKYTPASLSYIVSMIIGYVGLRYLELSVVSPVQNASGALSAVLMIVYFTCTGKFSAIREQFTFTTQNVLNGAGVVGIFIGVILLAVFEQKKDKKTLEKTEKKYESGALALLFPILYCLFDTVGTAADGIILSETSGIGLGETDVLILYGLTFFIVGLGCFIFLWIRQKKPYNPFTLSEVRTKGVASLAEEFGQIFYIVAMSKNPIVASPMIASYCIVSVILSRALLKEKLDLGQAVSVGTVIFGIVLLGIAEVV